MTATPRISPSGPVLVIPPAGAADPIAQQLWMDITKPDGGNGSIVTPYNTWADVLGPLQFGMVNGTPWVINLAQGVDASGTPVPDMQAGGHDFNVVSFRGSVQQSVFGGPGQPLSGVVFATQNNGNLYADFTDLSVFGLTFPEFSTNLILTGEDSVLRTLSALNPANVSGYTHLINCSVVQVALPLVALRMNGGDVDLDIDVSDGFLDDVLFFSTCQFRYHATLNLTNCRFTAGAQILCDANQQLNMDLDTWGSMVAAGVTFPDTRPAMVITPWVPIMGQVLVGGSTPVDPGGVLNLNCGTIAPQEAEASTACVATFGNVQNSHLSVVGSSINASRELVVQVVNNDVGTVDLVDVLFNVTYLPRISAT
jgi:hypothetical protein